MVEQKTSLSPLGKKIYDAQCAECHAAQGQGKPPDFPPLANNQSIVMNSAVNPIRMVLNGGYSPGTFKNPKPYGMPRVCAVAVGCGSGGGGHVYPHGVGQSRRAGQREGSERTAVRAVLLIVYIMNEEQNDEAKLDEIVLAIWFIFYFSVFLPRGVSQ